MRLSDLIDIASRLRRQYIAVAEGFSLGNRDMPPRLAALSAVVGDLEKHVAEADLAKDPLASLIYRSRQELRRLVENGRDGKRALKPVRHLAERSYAEACRLGYRADGREWRQLISAGICGAM